MQTLQQIRENLENEYPTLTASVNGVDVELTFAERKTKLDEWAKNIYDKAVADKELTDAKNALLAKLGITEAEAKLLLA
jgi:hypothetical protein